MILMINYLNFVFYENLLPVLKTEIDGSWITWIELRFKLET